MPSRRGSMSHLTDADFYSIAGDRSVSLATEWLLDAFGWGCMCMCRASGSRTQHGAAGFPPPPPRRSLGGFGPAQSQPRLLHKTSYRIIPSLAVDQRVWLRMHILTLPCLTATAR